MQPKPQVTHRQRWLLLIMLLHLVAICLPAHSGYAADEALTCAGVTVQAAAGNGVTSANEAVEIPKALVDRAFYTANWRFAYKDAAAVKALIYDELLIRSASKPDFDGAALQQVMDTFQRTYEETIARKWGTDANRTADELVHTALDVALDLPALQPLVPGLVRFLQTQDRTNYFPGRDASKMAQVAQSAQRYGLGQRLEQLETDILQRAYECAKANPAVAKVYDQRHSSTTKSSVNASAREIVAQNPNLPVLKEILDQVGENGSITLSLNQLNDLSRSEFAKINAGIGEIKEALVEIDKQQGEILDYLKDEAKQRKLNAENEARAAAHKLRLDALNSSVYLLSTFTGFIDAERGKEIAVVGKAAVQVYASVTEWMRGLSKLDKVGASLSTVVLTGNLLGAVMGVVSLIGDAGPTPEQMILEEIGKLRQQVNELRTEMHDRFDRIDQGLNTIYTGMMVRFNQIDVQLGKLTAKVQEIQQGLTELDTKLSRIERNNFELINALGRRELVEAVNLGLGYQERTGVPMPFTPDFDQFANKLYTWATFNAYDPVATGPSERDYRDAAVLTELRAYPLDANLNYLNGWLQSRGVPGISNKPLPSPRDWLFATRAYTQLGVEWPAHMQTMVQNAPQRHEQLAQISTDMEAAIHNISTLTTLTGTVGNELLMSTVSSYYQEKLDRINVELEAAEALFVSELGQNLQQATTINLFGGIEQPLTYKAPEAKEMTCNGEHSSLPAPNTLEAHIPNFNRYNLASYLGLGRLKSCATGEWVEVIERCEETPSGGEVCKEYGRHKALLVVYFNDVMIMRQSITNSGAPVLIVGAGANPTRSMWSRGANFQQQFAALSTLDTPSAEEAAAQAALLTKTSADLAVQLAAYQRIFAARTASSLREGPLRAAANELAGGKLLLDSFITLGFAHALEKDDFLKAMLNGREQLLGDSQITQRYAISATQPITGAILTVNPRMLLRQEGTERQAALSLLIDRYLDAITAQTHVETVDYIASTRRELALTVRIAQIIPAAPADQTISFAPLSDRQLGDPAFPVTATASSGLGITFVTLTPPICTVSDNLITLAATGTCTLQATQPGNASFNPATPVVHSFAVKSSQKQDQTITFGPLIDQQLGTPPVALNGHATSGLTVHFRSNTPPLCTVDAQLVTLLAIGHCSITATQEGDNLSNPATPVTQTFRIVGPESSGEQQIYLPMVLR